jgi:hypothetical protein
MHLTISRVRDRATADRNISNWVARTVIKGGANRGMKRERKEEKWPGG